MESKQQGRSLRTVDAARILKMQPDQFSRRAKQAGVEGRRERHGHLYWSLADVEAVREHIERNRGTV